MFITLKPREERAENADQVIARLRPQLDKVPGAKLFLQAAQDVRVGGRTSRTQFQYTLQGSDIEQLNEWAPKMLAKLKSLPELRDVATDQQTEGTTLTLTINRDQASRYGLTPQLIDDTLYDAFGQRQIAQYFTQLSSYYVIMEVLPSAAGRSRDPRPDLPAITDDRRPGAALGLRQMDDRRRSSRCRSAIRASSRRSPSASIWRRARRSVRPRTRSSGPRPS